MEAVFMNSLLKKLADLLADEYGHLKGVRREIRFLRSELNSMQAVLQKCASLQDLDVQTRAWTMEVRELAYDIEDCVDHFVHGVGAIDHYGPGGIKEFFRKSARRLKTLGTRHRIAKKIKELKARVVEVAEQRARYKLDDVACSSSNQAIDHRLCALFMEEADLVGIDGPRDDLVSWLVEGEIGHVECRKVLSIFGFGGLGKTTLANEVRRKIGKQFECSAFVSVSQNPDVKRVLRDLLSQLPHLDSMPTEGDTWHEWRIIEKIRQLLQDKRYFIVIDDIWSTEAWQQLKCALPDNRNGSRVITTTRIESVAKACCSLPCDRCYKIEPLTEFNARNLFFKRIFTCEDGCPVQLKQVSAEILRKCGGLPLAIVSIASLLASKPAKAIEQWEKVRASIGSALEKHPDLEGMRSILLLSYNDLPHYLKPCLLYLSIFPEDYDIERGSLIRRWTAEGFINEERGQNVEDVAESYFNELINRSMIQPVGISYDGKARACRLHDMMLELITSKAVEENFVTIIGPNNNVMPSKPGGAVRRLSVQYHGEDHKLAMASLSHVRSFSVFSSWFHQALPFADFRVLRVLCLDCEVDDAVNLNMVCKLKQLKFLRLDSYELPARIGELKCLETLEWNNNSWSILQPHGVAQLQRLKHLVVGRGAILPESLGRMHALQILTHFNICSSPATLVQELGNLRNLKELSVSWNKAEPSDARYKEYLYSSLCKLGTYSLRSLRIDSRAVIPVDFLEHWSPPPHLLQRFWMWNSYFHRCPKWIASLNNLTEIKLDVWDLEDEDLNLLAKLPALLHFQLWVVSLHKEKIIIGDAGFQSIVAFRLWSGLPCLSFQERSMPKLETLELLFSACGARSYGSTHSGIEHLRNLKIVRLEIYRDSAPESDIEAAEREIKNAIAKHPNNLKTTTYISTFRYCTFGEVMNGDDQDREEGVCFTGNNDRGNERVL